MNDIVSFGEWVQTRRNQLRYSRTQLAKLISCSPVTIKKIERDERRPSAQIAELLAHHLQVSDTDQDAFIRRARGEFVARFGSPVELTWVETNEAVYQEDVPKHNLPSQTTLFLGREQELAQITEQLENPNCRLLTILGPGGIGKTRLSVEVAKAQLEKFTDGVVYLSLAPLAIPDSTSGINPIIGALADALKLTLHSRNTPEQQLLVFLRRKEMLLIFDNFEHLLETAVFLHDILLKAPDIKIVTTSRERLNLQQEWLFPLYGLLFPDPNTTQIAVAKHSAVQLFIQRAQQVKPTFDIEQELPAILQICKQVEGLPLALELAAAWTRQLTCQQISAEIKAGFDFLTSHARNIPERHRSLRATFDYSWQQLTIKERAVLQRLSLFRGGFALDAAKAVANTSLPILLSLADKSLLNVSEIGRYQIHELLRQFLAEKLSQAETEEANARSSHCHYFLTQIGEQALSWSGPNLVLAASTVREEIDNIRAAINFGIHHHHELLTRDVGRSLFSFYEFSGWYREAEATFRAIANALKPNCNVQSSTDVPLSLSPSCLHWAMFQFCHGYFLVRLVSAPKAIEVIQQALTMIPNANDSQVQWIKAWGLWNLSEAYRAKGDIVRAFELAQASARLSHEVGHVWGKAFALYLQGNLAQSMGNYYLAQTVLQESERHLIRLGNMSILQDLQMAISKLACYRGELQTAHINRQTLLINAKQKGYQSQIAEALEQLAEVDRLQGHVEAAHRYYHQSMAIAKEHNLLKQVALALWGLGNLAVDTADFSSAKGSSKNSLNSER